MTGTPFTYGSCLDIVHKEALSLIATFLGVSINKSANEPSMVVSVSKSSDKPYMIEKIDSYVKSNPIEVLEKLCVKELAQEFVKACPNTSVVKAPCRIDTLKMFLLVSVCYDKKTKKENLLMTDELRDSFAPHLDFVLRKLGRRSNNRHLNWICR